MSNIDLHCLSSSYDADEPATAAVPTTQPNSDPEPVEPVPPEPIDPPPVEVKAEDNNDGSLTVADESQSTYANGQDDREHSRWDNNGRGSRMDVAVEQDSGAIGIKEDG